MRKLREEWTCAAQSRLTERSNQPKADHAACVQQTGALFGWPIFPSASYTIAACLDDSIILTSNSDLKDKKEKSP